MITYSSEFELYRTTPTSARRQLIESFTEPSEGSEEFYHYMVLAASATDVAVPIGGLSVAKTLVVNAKPNGGTTDADLLLNLTYEAAAGVPVGVQSIRFGSQTVVLDSRITGITLTNLGTTPVDIQIKGLGE